jgi:uncharacterized protein (DUF1800 family)
LVCVATVLVVSAPVALGKKNKPNPASAQMAESKRALHALNRLTFGPRPGDVERVTAMGVDKWIDQQLHPEKINDDPVQARLVPLRTLRMDTREIVENFPPPQIIKAVAEGKVKLPSDPTQRAVYEAQIERYQMRQEKKQEAPATSPSNSATDPQSMMSDEDRSERREQRIQAEEKADKLLDLSPDQRMNEILKMSPQEQRLMAVSFKGRRDEVMEGMDAKQRETLMALYNPQQVVSNELAQGKLLRAIYSERQLEEVMTDFWFNHFNVFINKGADRFLVTSYERDVIQPHAMGKFEDLLVATAKSPAMLFYLDNWLSVGPDSDAAEGIQRQPEFPNGRRRRFPARRPARQLKPKSSGLNENYGRELMELHTLGVNGGGYTQKDVTEVARVFTGWTLRDLRHGGEFAFAERLHEPGDKTVLGRRIKSGGENEGLEVLHLLAHHPATAKFICTKLATRFVSDDPPPALVDRMAQTFLKKDGDIREVLKTMLQSPEFWSPDAYRAKVKTPLEFVASAVRATGAEVTDAMALVRQLQNMGMPLYAEQPPTGYSMKADAWVNSSALLGRMNFALALAAGKLKGVQVDAGQAGNASSDAEHTLESLEGTLLDGDVSKQTHDTIAARLEDPKITERRLDDPARVPNVAMIEGLLLGSPEFQRR